MTEKTTPRSPGLSLAEGQRRRSFTGTPTTFLSKAYRTSSPRVAMNSPRGEGFTIIVTVRLGYIHHPIGDGG